VIGGLEGARFETRTDVAFGKKFGVAICTILAATALQNVNRARNVAIDLARPMMTRKPCSVLSKSRPDGSQAEQLFSEGLGERRTRRGEAVSLADVKPPQKAVRMSGRVEESECPTSGEGQVGGGMGGRDGIGWKGFATMRCFGGKSAGRRRNDEG
jgi:hypothetical protein